MRLKESRCSKIFEFNECGKFTRLANCSPKKVAFVSGIFLTMSLVNHLRNHCPAHSSPPIRYATTSPANFRTTSRVSPHRENAFSSQSLRDRAGFFWLAAATPLARSNPSQQNAPDCGRQQSWLKRLPANFPACPCTCIRTSIAVIQVISGLSLPWRG